MGFLGKLFGKKEQVANVRKRKDQPDVMDIKTEDDGMNWAMEKARLTLHYFEKCLQSPKAGQVYFSVKVKIVDAGRVEHIWLTEPSFDDEGNLFGLVGNEPIDVKTVSLNQKIGIERKLVSDWMIMENGRLIGGYTIRVLRDKLTGQALANFDKALGGMHVDYGEDYFLPSDTTPEGAIVKIEEAYDNDNLDAAIECKDFTKEAELMLERMAKQEFGSELVDKTAELLKLSFIKSLQENGMPKFKGVVRAFPFREKISENHIIITEVCYYPDGTHSVQRLNTFKSDSGWKVLNPAD